MHKIELKFFLCIGLFCFLFVLLVFCINKNQELADLTVKKHSLITKKHNISKLSQEIRESSFHFVKPSCLIFNTSDTCKNIIKGICKKSHFEKSLFKVTVTDNIYCNIKSVEIKFSAIHERDIYDFIFELQKKLGEVIIFDKIKIIKKDKHHFISKIQLRLLCFDKSIYKKSIIINRLLKNISCDMKSIYLFPKDEESKIYTLHCVIEKSQAYINDSWINIGDELDNIKIKNIHQNSIDIERENKIINIVIGSSW